ncbi:unnamed protein product, partial [Didymodactylos carnosus]
YPIRKNRTIQFSYAKLFQRQKPSKRLQNRSSPRQTRHNQNVPQLVMIAEIVQDLISRNLADYKNSGLICYDRETIDKQLFEYLKRYYKLKRKHQRCSRLLDKLQLDAENYVAINKLQEAHDIKFGVTMRKGKAYITKLKTGKYRRDRYSLYISFVIHETMVNS